MAVGRISGPLLKSNLVRNGIDLAFETDLLYLDVNNQKVGIKTSSPQHELDVNGTIRTTNFTVTNQADVGDITIQGNTISTDQNFLNLGTLDTVVYQNKLRVDSIDIEGNVISTNSSNANLELAPNGTGTVEVLNDMNVTGNLHATGNITADGDIVLGDQNTDSIIFNAEVASDIVPDAANTYQLGTDPTTGGKQWKDVWVQNFYASSITTDALTVNGIDLVSKHGNIYYVAENGADGNDGDHPQAPFATIQKALSVATGGDTIHIYPGEYTEAFPMTVPVGVTVKGQSIRSVNISPTTETRYNDAFLMNGESTVEDLTVKDFYSGGRYFDVTARGTGTATVNVGATPFAHTYVSGGTVKFEGPKVYPDNPATIYTTTASGTNTFTVNVGTAPKAHTYIANSGTATFGGTIVYPTVAGKDYITTASGTGTVTVNVGTTTKAHTYVSGGTIASSDSTSYNITGATYDESTGVLVVTHDGPDIGVSEQVFLSNITFNCAPATYTVESAVYDHTTGVLVVTHTGGGDTGVGANVTFEGLLFDCADETANITGATYNHTTGELVFTHDGASTFGSVGARAFLSNLTFSCNNDTRVFPDNGYAFRFATDFETTTRSPYIRNITVLTKGTTITADDPRGFLSGDAGKGAYVDGAYATAASREAAMLFHSVTFITPGVDGLVATNGARIEWLNSFTYFANRGLHAFDSNAGLAYDGKTSIRLSGISGTFLAGDEVTFTSTDASTVVVVTVESVNNDILVVDGKDTNLLNFDTTPQSIVATTGSGATATTIENIDVRDFGAEVRMIGSANVYGNFGLVGDGEGVIVYAIGQNLAYIGNGKEVTNDPESVNQANEVVELNGAKVRYNSFDHLGDFRVGDLFTVDQDAGTVSFVASALNIDVTSGITFTTGGDTTFISGERIDTGNIRLSGNTIESTAGDLNFDANSNTINLLQNVNITGNLDVTGNVSIGGNITIGNDPTDTIQIVAGIESDILPSQTNTYSLGTSAKTWSNLFVNESTIDGIRITQNYITTTDSNADLDLRANGTGNVVVPSNDVQIDQDLTVDGTATLANTNITGTITLVGDFTQTGDTTVTGDVDVTQDMTVGAAAQFEEILIDDNYITTTSSNTDLELRANGTGQILIPNNNVTINNDLTVNGFTTTKDITSTGLITADSFTNTNILIDDNFITTTVSNSDLELRASGTGSIVIDDFSFNDATISTIADMTFVPGSGNVNINGTGSLKIPVGNTAQRPAPVTGQIRFNSEKGEFEGYNGTYWIRLDGLQDLDGDTRITAELTPGANDNTIRFYVNNNVVADINNSRLNTNRLTVDDIEIDGNVISSITTNTDLSFSANGTGLVKFENFGFADSTIKNTVSDAVTVFENTGDGYVKFDGTQGIVLPVGDNATRPSGVTGMIRFNTDDARVELYDGTSWVSVAGASGGISFAQAEDIAIEKVLIFG